MKTREEIFSEIEQIGLEVARAATEVRLKGERLSLLVDRLRELEGALHG